MPVGKGYEITAAIDKGASWGTAVDVNGALKKICLLTENITPSVDYLRDSSLCGNRFPGDMVTGRQDFTGTIEMYNQYTNINIFTLIAMAMGRAGTPAIVGLDAADGDRPYAYVGSIKLRDSLEGYFFTLAIDKQVAIHEWDSVKMNSFTISGNAGERVQLSFDVIARKWNNSSAVNTTLASATEPTPRKYVMFEDGQFRINTQSGSALDGDNQVYPSAFTITVNNSMDPTFTSQNDPYVDEPVSNDLGEVTGTLTIPKYTTKSYENAFVAGTKMKMDIRFISSVQVVTPGGGAYYYEHNLYFPQIQITNSPTALTGPERITNDIEFTATRADTAPDGMDGSGANVDSGEARGSVTLPLEIEYKSVETTDPLG